MVLPLSLRSVAVFVLCGLNTTEAKPIRYLKVKKEHCLVFSAEWHINESFEGTPLWWPWSRELCARAILSLKYDVFRFVDWILWLRLRALVDWQTWWQQTRMWLIEGFSWNSRYSATRYPARTPTMISKRTGWHKVCIAVFGNKVIPFLNCIGAPLSGGVMQRCLSKLKRWLLGMLANSLIRQGCESTAKVEWLGIVNNIPRNGLTILKGRLGWQGSVLLSRGFWFVISFPLNTLKNCSYSEFPTFSWLCFYVIFFMLITVCM